MPEENQLLEGDLEMIIASCMRRVDQGEAIDQRQLLLDHPHLSAELKAYFADVALIEQLAGPTASELLTPSATQSDVRQDAEQQTQLPPKLAGQFGRYHIESVLGEGAMGSVYLAHDSELDRKVALKVPKLDEPASEAELLERFYREARAAATLRHRGICPVYDVGSQDGFSYIAMAYISGMPLSRFLAGRKLKSMRKIAAVIRKLALALDAAHQKGVIHRDLKPANIMLDEDNEPVIMDFGLARQINREDASRLTIAGTIMGTPAYMSPEQVSGNIDLVGPQSDIYSLGVIFYEMLTGQLPFTGPVVVIIGQIIGSEPARPLNLRTDIDPALETICLKMMAKETADRYQSMQEVAEDLTAYLKQPTKPAADEAGTDSSQTQHAEAFEKKSNQLAAPARIPVRKRRRKQSQEKKAPQSLWERIRKSATRSRIFLASAVAGSLMLLSAITLMFQVDGRTVVVSIEDPTAQVVFDDSKQVDFAGAKLGHVKLKAGPHTVTVTRNGMTVEGWDQFKYVVKEEGQNLLEIEVREPEPPAKVEVAAIPETQPELKEPESPAVLIPPPPQGTWLPGPPETEIPGFIERPTPILGVKRWQIISKVSASLQYDVAYSPDQSEIAAASGEGLIRIYDTQSLKLKRVLRGHTRTVQAVAWRPDGKQIASASMDGSVRLWSAEGKTEQVLTGGMIPCSIAWRPDGKQILSGGNRTLRLWSDTGEPQKVLNVDRGGAHAVAYRPDGQQFAAGGSNMLVQTWNLEGTRGPSFAGHYQQIDALAYSPDGKEILSGGYDSTLRLNRLDGLPSRELEHQTSVMLSVDYRPDSLQLATGGKDGSLRLWGSDGTPGPVMLGKDSRGVEFSVYSVRYLPGGKELVSGAWDNTVRFWDTDGRPGRVINGINSPIYKVACRPDGKQLAIACRDDTVRLYSIEGKQQHLLKGHFGRIYGLIYHPDGTHLASASQDRTVRLWNVDGTSGPVLDTHESTVYGLDYRFDGAKIITGGGDNSLRFWSPEGVSESVIEMPLAVMALDADPDGDKVIIAYLDYLEQNHFKGMQVLSASGKPEVKLQGHPATTTELQFRPDGQQIASVSWDQTLRLWDAKTGEAQLTIVPVSRKRAAVFTPAGELLLGKPADFDDALAYITEFNDGSQEILTPSEFYEKYQKLLPP